MKKIILFLTLGLFVFASCNTVDEVCSDCDGPFSETITMFVYEEYNFSEDAPDGQCLSVQFDSFSDEDSWENFYPDICGFDYVPGYRYEISVKREKIGKDDDGKKIYHYCLIKIVSSKKVYL